MSLDNQKSFYDLWQKFGREFSDDILIFDFNEGLEDLLKKDGIESETIRKNEIRVQLADLVFDVFETKKDYLKLSVNNELEEILIIEGDSKPLSFFGAEQFVNFEPDKESYFFSNTKAYRDFIEYLENLDQDQEDAFHFVDSVNTIGRRMVFTSPSEKGRVVIEYYNSIPLLDEGVNFSIFLQKFKDCFEDKLGHLPKFLKSTLIDSASRSVRPQRMYDVFTNLDNIIETAHLNFEIYLNNLSIDQVRKDYDDFKSKYFKEVSEILKNVTQKIIGLPIVVASTLFALDRVKDNNYFLIILLIAIIITSAYLTVLLRINFKDLRYISVLSEKDYDDLKSNKFFVKYPEELKSFQSIRGRISSRVDNMKLICESYFWILNVINIFMVALITRNLGLTKNITIGVGIILLFLLILSRNWILNTSEQEKL